MQVAAGRARELPVAARPARAVAAVAAGRARAVAAVAVLAAGWLLGGCGASGPALVDSSTTRPVPTATLAPAATRPGAATATTGDVVPSTTSRVPVTTGELGPAGEALTFRKLTLRLRPSWRAGGGGDHVVVATSRACRRSAGGVDCPGFLLLGPSQIAIAHELGPYDPEAYWHPGTGVEGCPKDRDHLAEVAPNRPLKRGVVRVGGERAVYREWRVTCVDVRTTRPRSSYRQRVWHLPAAGILIVDEWSTSELGAVLAAARFR